MFAAVVGPVAAVGAAAAVVVAAVLAGQVEQIDWQQLIWQLDYFLQHQQIQRRETAACSSSDQV